MSEPIIESNIESKDRTPQEMSDFIRNQPPLRGVFEGSDYQQGMERGRMLERQRIIDLLNSVGIKSFIDLIKGK